MKLYFKNSKAAAQFVNAMLMNSRYGLQSITATKLLESEVFSVITVTEELSEGIVESLVQSCLKQGMIISLETIMTSMPLRKLNDVKRKE